MTTNEKIIKELETIQKELIQKNIDYGDSLQNPLGVFQQDKLQGILGRIDDKLNRIKTVGLNDKTEDTIGDLIGYLIHLKIMLSN
tara:strand:+ start:3446 stop:3700 length:255 start_codon:yes stop_codon:yes gene_type:complete